jgi:CheY-like chemotaxis protein
MKGFPPFRLGYTGFSSAKKMASTRDSANGLADHVIHFYEGDEALYQKVSAFLTDAARAGQPLVVFADASHREAILNGLRARGIDTDALRASGRLAWGSEGPMPGLAYPKQAGAQPESERRPISLRVLVVDDNVDSAETIGFVLRKMGHQIRTEYDGASAIAAADAFRPDLILLDIGLPGMNGHEVAREIRQTPWGGTTTIIAVSGWGEESDRQESRAAGFDHHVTKPLDFEGVQRLLTTVENTRQPGRRNSA